MTEGQTNGRILIRHKYRFHRTASTWFLGWSDFILCYSRNGEEVILFLASMFGILVIASLIVIIDYSINGDDDYEEMARFQEFKRAMARK